jgi:tRNA(fMet)-specific endonuclease VapC
MRFVLDTTAFSAAMRYDTALLEFLKKHRPGDIVTVPPVVAEIEYGIKRLDKSSKKYLLLRAERDKWLSVIEVLPWSSDASKFFGKIKSDLERRGQLIDDFDIAIGAIASAHRCSVITNNLDHFRRIDRIQSISWK